MIRLEIEPYCHGCKFFRAESEGPETYTDFFGNEQMLTDIVVRCVDHKRCAMLSEYLKEKKDD